MLALDETWGEPGGQFRSLVGIRSLDSVRSEYNYPWDFFTCVYNGASQHFDRASTQSWCWLWRWHQLRKGHAGHGEDRRREFLHSAAFARLAGRGRQRRGRHGREVGDALPRLVQGHAVGAAGTARTWRTPGAEQRGILRQHLASWQAGKGKGAGKGWKTHEKQLWLVWRVWLCLITGG